MCRERDNTGMMADDKNGDFISLRCNYCYDSKEQREAIRKILNDAWEQIKKVCPLKAGQ